MTRLNLLCAASVVALFANPAIAQDAQEQAEARSSGDIIVTANRTESLLSKTPIAISAFSGEDLVQSGITNPTQLADSVPNVSIVRGNGLQITIRGVTSTDNTEKGDPSAAFMLNGIYIARPQAQEVSFFDIERVEVLRGPQGTLYGRNSTAGVINVLSRRPEFDLGGSADVSYGSYNTANITAALNLPLGETFAIRAAANLDRRDSHLIDGAGADGIDLDPFKDNKSLRLSALFEPSESFSVLLVGDYADIGGNPTNGVHGDNFFTNIIQGARTTFERPTYIDPESDDARLLDIPQAQQALRDAEEYGVMGEITWNFGPATFSYLGSYRESHSLQYMNVANGLRSADFSGDYWQTSHEARLAFGDGGPLQAQVGGYYFKERSGIGFFLNNLPAFGPNTRFGFPQDPTIAENKSVFGQATYEVLPDLRLTGGLRYSHDLKSRVGNTVLDIYTSVVDSTNIGNLIVRNIFQNNNASRNFSKVTWRAGVDYDSALGLIFASVSTGYKAGGFNDGCEAPAAGQPNPANCALPAEALYYDPETLTAYEAGFKFRLSSAIRLNATVFHYDYKGLQLSQIANVCGAPCQVTTNAASAKVDGFEIDTQIEVLDGLTLRGAINYLNARYGEFDPQPTISFAGRRLNRSPEWTGSVGLNYTAPVGEGEIELDGGIRFSSMFELTDLSNFAYFYQPSYTRTDLSVTYRAAESAWYLGAFVQNLEDNLVLTGATAGADPSASFGDPRQIGVRFGISF
jgi:iron complex outermembrane recepter protein